MSDDTKSVSHPKRSRGGSEAEGSAVPAISSLEPSGGSETSPLVQLRRFTPARIALGRSGGSLPTRQLLAFGMDHALARDAVHASLDFNSIAGQLQAAGLESLRVRSAATDRAAYLRRPDLGRKLDEASRSRLSTLKLPVPPDTAFIIADGLSAVAPERYAVPVILALRQLLPDWHLGPVIVAEQARVAVGDEIGELLGAEITVVLIGERPGLTSPDSLGIYLTYAPRMGRSDAERNCISNVRLDGMSIDRAAETLRYLLEAARRLKLSGVGLKDESQPNWSALPEQSELSAQKQIKSS